MPTHHLAIDLGAESGRVMLGTLDQDRLTLREIHRFPNGPVESNGSLHWNLDRLFEGILTGLTKAGQTGLEIASISTDSWGLDYVLIDANGKILPPAFCYRDGRCAQGVENALKRVSREEIFAETGIQFLPMNSVFQWMSEEPARLEQANRVLGIGDAVNHFLSGVAVSEASLASTTQLYDPVKGDWSASLIEKLALRRILFPKVVPSGTVLGPLKPELAKQTGLDRATVIATCSHDTGAAVVGVPAQGNGWAYLSSGTWSLLGVEQPTPVLTATCRELNFTNEIGFGNSVRLLKNLSGLWILQECRRIWAGGNPELSYETLTREAADSPTFGPLIDPSDPRFLEPCDMPARIANYCNETGQPPPRGIGQTVRCVLESLALLYARTVEEIEQLTGKPVQRLHIVGGGSQNTLLNQLTANSIGMQVLAGPVEATAAGNILVQAIGLGLVKSLDEARAMMRRTTELPSYQPLEQGAWSEFRQRFAKLDGMSR